MDSDQHALSMLSLSKKAGKIRSGEFQTEEAVKSRTAALAVIAGDASGNTKKKFHNMCTWYKVLAVEFSDKSRIGSSIGCESRSCLAILDAGLANAFLKALGRNKDMERR